MYYNKIKIPENVDVEINNLNVKIKGPKGEIYRTFKTVLPVKIEREGNEIKVSIDSKRRKAKSIVGTISANIRNAINDVLKGYYCKMKMVYMHFPFNVKVDGDKLLINNFLGERVPRVAKISKNVKVRVENEFITIEGVDRNEVMQSANNIEQAVRITGYDRRVFLDGIFIIEKGPLSE